MKRIFALLILSTVFCSACTSTKWVRTSVAKEYDFTVALEQLTEKGAIVPQTHEQPQGIDPAELKKVLGDLIYTEKAGLMSKSKLSSVFQQTEIDRLTPVLAATLAKAEAGQRLRFISFNQGQSVIFSESQKTEGVVFVDPAGQLNIAFNYVNAKRLPNETSAIYSNYSEIDPLKITTSDTPLSAPAPYAELHQFETGEPAPMWVVADLGKLKESISTGTVPVVKAKEEIPPAAAPKTETVVTPVEITAPASASDDMLKTDIKNKLKYLKELLDEGLISAKDYEAKKKELLDKID
jgi:hypothetical protein